MAYARRAKSTRKTSSYTRRRGSAPRTARSTGTRRPAARRATSRARSPQTIRIVIEQPTASAVARPLVEGSPTPPPRQNKF